MEVFKPIEIRELALKKKHPTTSLTCEIKAETLSEAMFVPHTSRRQAAGAADGEVEVLPYKETRKLLSTGSN